MKFVKEFFKMPGTVGAVAPSSKYLAEKMVETIDFENCKCLVEYGPGTGVFTEKLIARKKEDTLLLIFEVNKEFYDKIVNLYGHKENVKIINDGAENLRKYLEMYNVEEVSYIVSGLPFTILPKEVSTKILEETEDLLSDSGRFITFQYSLVKIDLFKKYFKNIQTRKTMRNIPPAYVLECK